MVQLQVAEAAALLAGMILGKPGPPAEIVDSLRERKPDLYTTRTIDASVARDREEFNVSGQWLYVNEDTASVDIEVRLNENDKVALNLSKLKLISLPFYRFFVTNAEGSGRMEIVIGKTGMMVSPSEVDIEVVASEIMLPIDIQGAYIMMPVDIQAQYLTLEIDIVAQTVGDISIDIAAQTIGNVTIDIEAQSVGIYPKSDWEVKEGNQKQIWGSAGPYARGSYKDITYAVPEDKVLYIYAAACSCWASGAHNADSPQITYASVWRNGTELIQFGGNGGMVHVFPAPLKYIYGETAKLRIRNEANHTCLLGGSLLGFEVDA